MVPILSFDTCTWLHADAVAIGQSISAGMWPHQDHWPLFNQHLFGQCEHLIKYRPVCKQYIFQPYGTNLYHTVSFVDDEILSFVQLYILWNQFVCVRERDGERERERRGYYAVLILIGKAYWNMLVPQHPILLHNHMIVMLNESNLPVYTCNDSDQNKLAQSDTMYYTITHSDSCSKTTENRSITYHAHREL